MLNQNGDEIDLKQSFDEDEEFTPHPVHEDTMDFTLGDDDLDEGFMAEDEDGVSELDENDDFDDESADESDLFLDDDE